MDENQDKIVINELKPFDKQVDDVLSGTDITSSHLEVLKITPPILRMVGVPNLPILMTARHVRTITQEDGADSANYHGLGVELVKHLPELISDPVMIMDSISPDAKAQNSIVIVTQMVDNKNRPVIGAIKLNGFGRQNSKIISANILTSAYGKDNFQSFIERNIKQGSVLYVDKEKSQALSVNPGIQFPDVMASLSFNTIIRKTNAFVNSDKQKSSEKSKRSPLLINLFAGPSAGKTTAALELTAALKKKGFNVEYVSEYAKELVLENKTELLKNQVHVTDEQFHRLDRLRNSGVEIIVTDSPVLLGKVYGEGKISREYGKKLLTYHNSFDNFNLFVNRGSTFQTEGRVHNLEQSKELDAKILAMLQDNRIFYGNYNHDEIDKTVERITTSFSRLKKLEETTEKNEGSMIADTNNANAQSARERVQQIRDSMVKTLLEHIEKNPTDWQSGWNNIAAGAPYNGKTNTAYRGLNALYLAFLGAERGYKDTRWVTFNQAKELGASVKKGEKSAPVIFFEFYDRKTKKAFDNRTVKDMTEEEKTAYLKENVYAVMKYSSVFNAEQCHNFPERKEIAMSEEEMANQNAKIETIIANSGAPIRYDGGSRAYYSPGTDSIHLPAIPAFDTMQDYYATALHEIAHSTGHESRLNRDLAGSFGSESYAKEELRAELACVFMQMEQGIQLNGKHITNHAAYLNSWLQAAKNDTSVFFKAAADAQRIADYVADNYLQAAAGAVIEEENVAQEQTEEQPERNPMADYLRAAQLDSAVSDAGERSWEQENIRDWYTSAYPNDEAGLDIHPNATFKDLRDEVNRPNPISVYGMLGEDSVVRERAFTRLAELSGSSYASIYSAFLGETAAQKLENARALAKRLAIETGEPYVTIEWSEHQALNSYDVMSLSEADKKLAALDAQEDKNEGYYKTKLHIDYVFEGEHDDYECCRFDIGSEGGGLVHHIDEFLKYDTFLGAEERQQAENALKYFKVHMDLSAMVDTAIASNLPLQKQFDVQSYVLAARGAVNSAVPFSTYKLPETSAFEQGDNTEHYGVDIEQSNVEGDHKEKITLEEARNAMLDAQEQRQNHYAVRIENVPYTDPEDGYESEEPAQVIYMVSPNGRIEPLRTITIDDDAFYYLPYTDFLNYEPVEYEELEELAQKVREPIQAYKDVLRAELEAGTERRRSEAYYDQRVDDILDEHYRTKYGLFERNIENPKYLSGTLYAEETFRGERVVSLTQDESGKNVAIIARVGGSFAVAEDYHTDDGRNWGKYHSFENQKAAEEFRAKNFPSAAERANQYQSLATAKSLLVQDYARIKGENADSIVFYRVGDFYEVLGADAERAAEKLNLTLTGRAINTDERIPMCGVPYHAIDQYADTLAKKGENVVVVDGTDFKAYKAQIDLTEKRLRDYADTLRRNDLEVGNVAQTDEYYLNQAREQIAAYERSDEYQQALREDFPNDFIDDIDDSPQDMAQIPQNTINTFCTDFGGEYTYFVANNGLTIDDICTAYAERPYDGFGYQFGTPIKAEMYEKIQNEGKGFNIDFLDDINAFSITQDGKVIDSGYLYEDLVVKYQERQNKPVEAQERKREWLSIELPNGTVGGQYGKNTMIKMPKGEFSYYSFYVPTRFLKEADGKTQLRVASDFTFRLNNDGRQVELTGQELKDSFAGKHLDKTYKRVAPSRRYAQGLADLEKNVPAELKAIPTWCCYRTRWNEEKGKKDKFIISPIDGKWTSSKEPGKWVTFDAALKYARENNCEGLSVLLDKQHGITCIDLDKCILNAETGEMKQRATKLVEALSGTYIERSTSGNGLHIFVKDDILKNGTYNSQSMVRDEDPRGDLEVFDDKRIMSLTGDMYSKGNTLTRACSAATVYLRQELGERRRIASNGTKPQPTASQSLSDNELIRWIRGSKQGAKFDDLYSGRGVSGDRSSDDGKLAHLLLYFNGGDKEQAFRIMRESGAYRPDKPDSYYRHTIDKMNDKIEVYAKRPTFSADGHGKPKGKGPGNGKKGSQA